MVSVRLLDRLLELFVELLEILALERGHHRRYPLFDELAEVLLVLGAGQSAELHQLLGLLQLELGERPVLRPRRIVELPDTVADLRHEPREPWLQRGEIPALQLAALPVV